MQTIRKFLRPSKARSAASSKAVSEAIRQSMAEELLEAATAVSAMLVDTPRDRLGRLDVVATETRERVRALAVRYGVESGDYMDQCGKVLRAAIAKAGK